MKQPTSRSPDRFPRAVRAGAGPSQLFADAAELAQRLAPAEPVFFDTSK